MAQQKRGGGLLVGSGPVEHGSFEGRDRVASAVVAQNQLVAERGRDPFVQRDLDHVLQVLVARLDFGQRRGHRQLVSHRSQIHPGLAQLSLSQEQAADLAASVEIGFFDFQTQRLGEIVERGGENGRQAEPDARPHQ